MLLKKEMCINTNGKKNNRQVQLKISLKQKKQSQKQENTPDE